MANNVRELTEKYFLRIKQKLRSINNPDWMEAMSVVIKDITSLQERLANEKDENRDYVEKTCVALENIVDNILSPKADFFEIEKEVEVLRNTVRNSQFTSETKRKIYMTGIGLACAAIVGGIVLGLLATNPVGAAIAGTMFFAACIGLYYRDSITKQLGWDRTPGTWFGFFNAKELSAESIYNSMSGLVSLLKTSGPIVEPVPEETATQQPQHEYEQEQEQEQEPDSNLKPPV